ncbi:class I adenylate-forming enzyme family protein [Tateyamaria sp. SN6-1]|uniref:class I adenylate-forming enzyme family protein n=1 Tax=Tateyamaria sp. SN6-1 TaxID=3092148 RepID=UPI0039F464DF
MGRVEDFLTEQVRLRPDAPAVEDAAGGLRSYGQLAQDAAGYATRITAELRPGDRVMIVSENCAAAVAAMFAAWHCGATVVPINARQSAREVDRVIAHADPRHVFFTAHVSQDAAAHATRLGARGAPMPLLTRVPRDAGGDRDVAVILYTTGTTGDPKGVMLTHGNVRFGAQTSATLRDMEASDVVLGVLPITHVFGLSSVLCAAVHKGAFMRLAPRFEPARVLETLRTGVTLFSGVPQMHALIMAHAAAEGAHVLGSDSLRYVSSGAAPLDPAWKRDAEAFYGVAVQNGYGMTESTAGIAATHHAIGNPDMSVGPPLPGVEVRIDASVPGGGAGQGEVLTRGPHVMPGYYAAPARTAEVLGQDGWLRTGDLGRFDAAGHLHILGRSKELIIRGGFNVYPPEVEAVLTDHPDVVQSAVIGRAVGGDEEVLAFVQPRAGASLTAEQLSDFAADRLAGYKRPVRYVIADKLPAAATGKILKHRLLDVFADVLD